MQLMFGLALLLTFVHQSSMPATADVEAFTRLERQWMDALAAKDEPALQRILAAEFSIVRAGSLDEAIEWATRQAGVLGDGEVDIRPVTEPWDIGMAPPPADAGTRRYMVLRKATAATEAGTAPSAPQRSDLARLIEETTRGAVHLLSETLRPSVRGRRYKNSVNGISIYDGPFIESKELIGGYAIVSAESLDDAGRWAELYIDAVQTDEVDLRELE